MSELKLKFKDSNGETNQISVSTAEFFVGRHSENDLSIANSAVSRRHLKIEKFGEMFVATDFGSSLGTKINGQNLIKPTTLKNGDKIILGNSVEIEAVFDERIFGNFDAPSFEDKSAGENLENLSEEKPPREFEAEKPSAPHKSNDGNHVSLKFFLVAPVFGILVLILIGGIFLVFRDEKEIAQGNDFIYSGNRENRINNSAETKNSNETNETNETKETEKFSNSTNEIANSSSQNAEIALNNSSIETNSEIPANQQTTNETADDSAKIETNSASFLRRIAQKDPRAALSGRQQEIVRGKINQFKNSTALAANLKSASANSSAIQTLAGQKNLKPQFLTAAALARLGTSQGDVLSTAQSMANVLDELSRNVGDEFSDDSLLVICAYEQGVAGKALEMRNMLQSLTDKFPESSRRIRTIWFLKENGKISDSQFDFALKFLAVGTISQNPRDFGVNAEAVKF